MHQLSYNKTVIWQWCNAYFKGEEMEALERFLSLPKGIELGGSFELGMSTFRQILIVPSYEKHKKSRTHLLQHVIEKRYKYIVI